MDRRKFLKDATLAGLSTAAFGLSSCAKSEQKSENGGSAEEMDLIPRTRSVDDGFLPASCDRDISSFHNFKFGPDGKFKIVQFTDTHYVDTNADASRALNNIRSVLDMEQPDLIIHTGDIIFAPPAEKQVMELFAPISKSGIPFAVALGNHDSQFGLDRPGIYNLIRTIPGNINSEPFEGISKASNDIITLSDANSAKSWIFYLFDTGDTTENFSGVGSYDYIHLDQILWYWKYSKAFTKANGMRPVPSLAFMHIPLPEFGSALHDWDHYKFSDHSRKAEVYGNHGEEPASPNLNSGLFVHMLELKDIKGVSCGHEHDNDYIQPWKGIQLMYGRYGGCDSVYNNLKPNGARVFEFTLDSSVCKTWIRLSTGAVEHEVTF